MFGELRPVDGGTPILLDKPSIMVGQDQTCDVVIEHPSVSATHCHMEFKEGHWFIEDLDSRCGTLVNGEKIASAWVPAWSVICIGTVEFDLQSSSTEPAAPTGGSISPELISKLERALKSVPAHKDRRMQVRADSPAVSELPKTHFGALKPIAGEHPIPLLYDELYLGRDPDSDVILPYLAVAKTHCVLRFHDGYWLVRDLNNNGVSIDGKTVQEGWLLPGTILGVADHHFEMAYVTTSSSPPPETVVPIDEIGISADGLADSDDESEALDIDKEWDAYSATQTDDDVVTTVTETPSIGPTQQAIRDEPFLAVDDMFPSAECELPQFESPQPPTQLHAPAPPTVEPPATQPPATQPQITEPRRTGAVRPLVIPEPPITEPPATEPPAAKPATPVKEIPPLPESPTQSGPETTSFAAQPAPPPEPAVVAPLSDVEPRVGLVQQKHERILQFLKDREFDGLLLTRPSNIAWYTGGADVPRDLFGQPVAALLLTPAGGTLLARASDAELFLNQAIRETGLKQRDCDWPDGSRDVLGDWPGQKNLACDEPFAPCVDASADVAALRLSLSKPEIVTLRKLGIRVARAVERAAREFQRGDTEAQIAGDVASRLVRHEVVPERIQVWGDGRGQEFQNWKFGRDPVDRYCTISVIARRQGLHIAVSRTVSFGTPPRELRWTYSDMLLTHATALLSSRDQAELSTVWSQVESACEKLGFAAEWRTTDPGCVTGYELCEAATSSRSRLRLRAGMPVIWQSALGPARAVDTILVQDSNCKILTQTGEWPQRSLVFDTSRIFGQSILQRAE